jgi:hypothetical protein
MSRKATAQVRNTVAKYYPYTMSFNDLRKNKTRRLKFIHLFEFSGNLEQIDQKIKRELDKAGIDYSDAGFKVGRRLPYTYYSVVLKT